jgi:hypothetical protein
MTRSASTRWPCCARAASGHAAAPPSRVMNARRFMCGWPLPSKRKCSVPHRSRLQSCVRPVDAARMAAGPMLCADQSQSDSRIRRCVESPDPRNDRVCITSSCPRHFHTTISHGLRDNDSRADLLMAGLYGGEVGNCTARFTRRHVLSGSKLVICMPISVVRQPRSFS